MKPLWSGCDFGSVLPKANKLHRWPRAALGAGLYPRDEPLFGQDRHAEQDLEDWCDLT